MPQHNKANDARWQWWKSYPMTLYSNTVYYIIRHNYVFGDSGAHLKCESKHVSVPASQRRVDQKVHIRLLFITALDAMQTQVHQRRCIVISQSRWLSWQRQCVVDSWVLPVFHRSLWCSAPRASIIFLMPPSIPRKAHLYSEENWTRKNKGVLKLTPIFRIILQRYFRLYLSSQISQIFS